MSLLSTIFAPNTLTIIESLGVDHTETIKALESIGKNLPVKPEFVVIVSPYFQTEGGFGIVSNESIRQIYDFYGFPEELYRVKYEPRGSPENARRLIEISIGRTFPQDRKMSEFWIMVHGLHCCISFLIMMYL
jgi:aromatic ring-opening dioxygenase catalytic subunit (LigB family)